MNFKVRFRRFIARYLVFFVELVYAIKFSFVKFSKPPIIILTPGKVGSSSIYSTLKTKTYFPVYHIHNLSEKGIEHSVYKHMSSDRKSKPLHLIVSKLLRKKLNVYNGKRFIITVIREPISREISSFFQNIDFLKSELENRRLEIDIDKAHKYLNKQFESDICKELEDWFELEIKGNFQLDIFKQPFNSEQKFSIIQKDKTELLLLRMEDLNSVFPVAIQEFLKLQEPLELKNENVGNTKHYAQPYQAIKNKLKLDSTTVERITESKFFKHFYIEQKDYVLDKWTKK